MNILGALFEYKYSQCVKIFTMYSGYAVNSNKVLFWSIYGEMLEEISNYSKHTKTTLNALNLLLSLISI